MPVPGFLSSFADKAQTAINSSPLGQHVSTGSQARPDNPGNPSQSTANDPAAQGGFKSHALDTIQYHLRTFSQQYSSNTSPVQKLITAEKGVALHFDSVSRESKAQSKELYTWGQAQSDDVRDVSDRLAYLNFVEGALSSSLAAKLDAARAPLKAYRDADAAFAPRRNNRAALRTQLARLEHEKQKGTEGKIKELREQLKQIERDDENQEKEVALLKRKAVRESEQLKWDAIREYAEKLTLLSKAATPIIGALPTLPPCADKPYQGAETTAAARASLQRALDNYKLGNIELPSTGPADLRRSDTRSFGVSHASELSSIGSDGSSSHPGLPVTPPTKTISLQDPEHSSSSLQVPSSSTPINPATLNQSPAAVPNMAPPSETASTVITPTVAETGVPVSGGPGPASGNLHDLRSSSHASGGNEVSAAGYGQPSEAATVTASKPQYESAEEEKKRLQRQETGQSQPAMQPQASTPQHETAEEEKKRLEREHRERILREGTHNDSAADKPDDTEDSRLIKFDR